MAFKGVHGVALITGVRTEHFANDAVRRLTISNIWAASGIGREAALAFAEAGASGIVFADLDEDGACDSAEQSNRLASHSNYRDLIIHVDITDAESVQAMVDVAVKKFGRIDYSVNCAGVNFSSDFFVVGPF